jgi:hypothetical protein
MKEIKNEYKNCGKELKDMLCIFEKVGRSQREEVRIS